MSWKCYQCDHVNKANELECDVCGATRNLYAEEVFELKENLNKLKEQLVSTDRLLILANANFEKKQKAFWDLERKHFEISSDYELQKGINTELSNNISDVIIEKNNQISLLENEISKIRKGGNNSKGWNVLFITTTIVSIVFGIYIYINSQTTKDNLQRTIAYLRKSENNLQISENNLQKTNSDLELEVKKLKAKIYSLPNQNSSSEVEDLSANIKSFLAAEESRDFNLIYSFISPEISRYYDLKNPSIVELRKRYQHLWSITSNSKNKIQEITKVNDYTYDLQTEFEYYNIKKKMVITVLSEVRFLFDENGKIIETYGLK